jgi:murein DD-endopeptidase MepM/ murein hydrolase activator NlpD
MAIPKLTIAVEPSEADALGYAFLAPGTASGGLTAQLSLRLDLTNKENGVLQPTQITIAFTPPPDKPFKKIGVSFPTADGPSGVLFNLPPNVLAPWFSGSSDNVFFFPFTGQAYISVLCKGFDPLTIKRDLVAHVNSVTAGGVAQNAYRFPADVPDLGEFWQGASGAHVPGVVGSALFAYDLIVVAYEFDKSKGKGKWTELKPGASGNTVGDYRAWNKPVRAMADGKVLSFRNDVANQPISATLPIWNLFDPDNVFKDKVPIAGNHLQVLHGDGERVIYGHLEKNSIPPKFLSINAPVSAHDHLGNVGNSGQSAKPSLLIQSSRPGSQAPLPVLFRDICVIDRAAFDPIKFTGPWYTVAGLALPAVTSLIWPQTVPPIKPPPYLPVTEYLAVDPLSRIISSSLYATLTKPRPQPFRQLRPEIAALLRRLEPAGRRSLSARLKALKNYADEIERLLKGKR